MTSGRDSSMIRGFMQSGIFLVTALAGASVLYWMIEPIHRGGPMMIPIVMCSIFAVAISLERLFYFLHAGEVSAEWLERLGGVLRDRRWDEAMAVCRSTKGPVAHMVEGGLAGAHRAPEAIERALEDAALAQLPYVDKHLRWLATIAQVATLLGLLGTVMGMVKAFQTIQLKTAGMTPVSPADLAGGIWEALLTTVAGLTVAIPTIVAYNYLTNRAGEIRAAMERVTSLVMSWINQQAGHATPPKHG